MNCCACAQPIPQARLAAHPLAVRCLGCQKLHEAIDKHFRDTERLMVPLPVPEDATEHLEAVEQALRDQPRSSIYLQIEGLDEL